MKGTLVLIHGMWCAPEHWEGVRNWFADRGWRVVVPALRHHDVAPNASPHPALGSTSLLDYAADLESEIRALGERPVLVGHSMGGLLAQLLAARGIARAAVLLSPAAPRGIQPLRLSVIRSFLSLLLRPAFWRRPHLLTSGEADYALLNRLPPEARARVRSSLRHESGRAVGEIGLWWLDRWRASAVDERRVDCPVLVVQGTDDRITPAAVTRRVARKYGAALRVLPGRAHWLIGEPGWEGICEEVERWLVTAA